MTYMTILSAEEGYGVQEIKVGEMLHLKKVENDEVDDECIRVVNERGIPVGTVANSVDTVFRGTHSSGYLYEMVQEQSFAKVLFVHEEVAIAQLVNGE